MDYAHYSAVRRDEQVLSARGAEYLFFFSAVVFSGLW